MTASLRRSLTTAVICGVLVSIQILVVALPSPATPRSSCAALRAWAVAYQNSRPTLDELAAFDRTHRLAIFNAVSPDVRAALWREQIRRLGEQPELTSAQRALTVEAIGLLTPALYRHEPQAMAAFQGFEQRADRAFVTISHRRVWRDLGAWKGTAASPAPAETEFCDCKVSLGSGQCGGVPCGNGNGCEHIQACGFSGLLICDGMCQW